MDCRNPLQSCSQGFFALTNQWWLIYPSYWLTISLVWIFQGQWYYIKPVADIFCAVELTFNISKQIAIFFSFLQKFPLLRYRALWNGSVFLKSVFLFWKSSEQPAGTCVKRLYRRRKCLLSCGGNKWACLVTQDYFSLFCSSVCPNSSNLLAFIMVINSYGWTLYMSCAGMHWFSS